MKVKPLVYKLSQQAFDSVVNNSEPGIGVFSEGMNKNKRGKALVLITEKPNILTYQVPVILENVFYGAPLPQPSSLFLYQAQLFAANAKVILEQFPKNVTLEYQSGEDNFSIVEHNLYYSFLAFKISSLTATIMSVECFINSIIPDEFTFQNKKGEIDNKQKIERFWTIKDKFKIIIPAIKPIKDLKKYTSKYEKLIQINSLRNEFIHLKTTLNLKNMDPFIVHFEELINLDLDICIESAKEFVRIIDENYFD